MFCCMCFLFPSIAWKCPLAGKCGTPQCSAGAPTRHARPIFRLSGESENANTPLSQVKTGPFPPSCSQSCPVPVPAPVGPCGTTGSHPHRRKANQRHGMGMAELKTMNNCSNNRLDKSAHARVCSATRHKLKPEVLMGVNLLSVAVISAVHICL